MSSDQVVPVISMIYDAALEPNLWPDALQSIAEAIGAFGAAVRVWNKRTGQLQWSGLSAKYSPEVLTEYTRYYAALDPYMPLVAATAPGHWLWFSERLSEDFLHAKEWYNDFLLKKCGVKDIFGTQLFGNEAQSVTFVIHRGLKQQPLSAERLAMLRGWFGPLAQAARLHVELCNLNRRSFATLLALDQFYGAVIIADSDGRVIELNPTAERIVSLGDGLMIRGGRLCARRSFETTALAKLIAAAAANNPAELGPGRMLIGRSGGRPGYMLTVTPLNVGLAAHDQPLAIVLVVDTEKPSSSATDFAEFFGLSPAESRLATALIAGKKLPDIALNLGVKISTLRTQIRSILQKVGVTRQLDVRVLSSTPSPGTSVRSSGNDQVHAS